MRRPKPRIGLLSHKQTNKQTNKQTKRTNIYKYKSKNIYACNLRSVRKYDPLFSSKVINVEVLQPNKIKLVVRCGMRHWKQNLILQYCCNAFLQYIPTF
jgi:hypothetical protein